MTPTLVCVPVDGKELSLFQLHFPEVYSRTVHKNFLLFSTPSLKPDLEPFRDGYPGVGISYLQQLPAHLWEFFPCLGDEGPAVDLIVIRPGILPPHGWDLRLHWAAHREAGLGAVFPLNDLGSVFSPAPEHPDFAGLVLEDANSLLYTHGARACHETPVAFPFAAHLRRDLLHSLPPGLFPAHDTDVFNGSREFARVLLHLGISPAICDHVYVRHEESPALQTYKRLLAKAKDEQLAAYDRKHPLLRIRHRLTNDPRLFETLPDPRLPGIDTRPVQLHVMHSWGGGLDKWVTEYCRSDQSRRNMVLKSIGRPGVYGERLVLYADIGHSDPVAIWDLNRSIRSTDLHHLQYARILEEIAERFNVRALLVSSFIGHSLDVLDCPLPTAIVCHDYFPHCPFIFSMHREMCRECREADFHGCLETNPLRSIFPGLSDLKWKMIRQGYLEKIRDKNIPLVVPTLAVQQRLTDLDPEFSGLSFHHIPHGIDTSLFPPVEPGDAARPDLVVLGELLPQKGLELFRSVLGELTAAYRVHLIGCGETGRSMAGHANIAVLPRYTLESLPGMLGDIKPRAALLLSVWPETFSYTLSEVMAMAIPPVATNIGAFAERIRDGETGILFEPTPEGLLAALKRLGSNPGMVERIRHNLRTLPHDSIQDMVQRYHALLPLPAHCSTTYFQGRLNHRAVYGHPKIMNATHVDTTLPFIEGLERFCSFAGAKIGHSPRIRGRLVRRFLQKSVWAGYKCINWLSTKGRGQR